MLEKNSYLSDSASILVVDDDKDIREIIQRTLEFGGYECITAANGTEALELLESKTVDIVIADIKMPGLNGITLTKIINEKYNSDVIIITGYGNGLTYERVIETGAKDFMKKPLSPQELLIRSKRILRERNLLSERNKTGEALESTVLKLRKTLDQTVNALASTVEMRDPYTFGHQRRVTQIACAIGADMGLSEDQIDGIQIAGLLHDIGKISIPSEILSKPGQLTQAEFNLLKDHPQIGYHILKKIEFPWPVCQIVLQHHEHLDGSGYPSGITDQDILLEAKILSVADVVEAMSSHRPYRASLGIESALEEISKNQGILYEPAVVEACFKVFQDFQFTLDE